MNIHTFEIKCGPWYSSVQFSLVVQSCPTLCDPMDHSTPGLPVHHQLPEFTQIHIHWVSDAIQPSHSLSSPSLPAFNLFQHQGLSQWVSSSHPLAKVLEVQLQHESFQRTFRTDFLQDGLVGSPCSPRDSQESSPTLQFKSINSAVLSFLHSRTLTSIHQFSSVAPSCPTLCNPMNRSTPGLPIHHHLPEFTQTHIHRVGDAIQPSHPLSSPSPPAPNPSQHQSLFQWVNSSHEMDKVLELQL